MVFDPTSKDPLGLALQQRARDANFVRQNAQRTIDYTTGTPLDQAVHMTGPLPDPQWQAFLQALKEQGVSSIKAGPSPPDSNQLTGATVQPRARGDAGMDDPAPDTGPYGGYQDSGPFGGFAPPAVTSASVLKRKASGR